jgi:hypothetical protein
MVLLPLVVNRAHPDRALPLKKAEVITDPAATAQTAGLHYVSDTTPGTAANAWVKASATSEPMVE